MQIFPCPLLLSIVGIIINEYEGRHDGKEEGVEIGTQDGEDVSAKGTSGEDICQAGISCGTMSAEEAATQGQCALNPAQCVLARAQHRTWEWRLISSNPTSLFTWYTLSLNLKFKPTTYPFLNG